LKTDQELEYVEKEEDERSVSPSVEEEETPVTGSAVTYNAKLKLTNKRKRPLVGLCLYPHYK